MKFNKILPVLALALFGLGACTDEVKYDPAQPEANVEAYFPAALGTSVSLDNDQNQFTVPVYRTSKSGAQTIALSATSTDNLFTVASAVTFADGSDEALVPVDFNFSSLEANKSYSVTITIDDAATTPYGKRTQTFDVKYAPWSAWQTMKGNGVYTYSLLMSGSDYVSVKTRTNLLDSKQVEYSVKGIYANDITISVDLNTNIVTVNRQDIGTKVNSAPCYIADSYTFWSKIASSPNYKPEDFKGKSTFNPETGVITLNLAYFALKDGGGIGLYTPGETEFLQLPGYPDYSMNFANNGSVITEQGNEFAVITVAKGSDVNGFALKLVPGYLDAKSIEKVADAMKADENITLYYEGGDYQFPIAEDGDQTLVALTYDAMGNYLNTQSYHFYYEVQQKDWNAGWTPLAEKLIYTDYFFFSKPLSWAVEVQENNEYPGYYRIVKPYAACENIDPADIERGHYYIYIDATNPNQVYIEPSYISLGYNIISEAYMMLAYGGATEADVTTAGVWGTWKDNTLTMPAQSFGIFAGFDEDGDWHYAAFNEVEAIVLQPQKAAEDEDEPGLGEEAFKAVAKKQIATGSNAIPANTAKDVKKSDKRNLTAKLRTF